MEKPERRKQKKGDVYFWSFTQDGASLVLGYFRSSRWDWGDAGKMGGMGAMGRGKRGASVFRCFDRAGSDSAWLRRGKLVGVGTEDRRQRTEDGGVMLRVICSIFRIF